MNETTKTAATRICIGSPFVAPDGEQMIGGTDITDLQRPWLTPAWINEAKRYGHVVEVDASEPAAVSEAPSSEPETEPAIVAESEGETEDTAPPKAPTKRTRGSKKPQAPKASKN